MSAGWQAVRCLLVRMHPVHDRTAHSSAGPVSSAGPGWPLHPPSSPSLAPGLHGSLFTAQVVFLGTPATSIHCPIGLFAGCTLPGCAARMRSCPRACHGHVQGVPTRRAARCLVSGPCLALPGFELTVSHLTWSLPYSTLPPRTYLRSPGPGLPRSCFTDRLLETVVSGILTSFSPAKPLAVPLEVLSFCHLPFPCPRHARPWL